MDKFIESFDEFKGGVQIQEASEIAEFNEKLKKMGEDAKEARELATKSKEAYEKAIKSGENTEATYQMLLHTKYKSKAAMLNADIDLMNLEKKNKGVTKEEPKKEEEDED